ncbi:MAG: VCBS repeat-containing protein, partial [Cyanobacteria bacterium HKST-UBA06]|nr:VCBS repeat-containing protein [Cyanobacteria bacterium HKST-UBA06]
AGGYGTTIEAGGWHNLTVGDFNGDGRDDIAARQNTGRVWYATSTGAINGPNLNAHFLELSPGANLSTTLFPNPFVVGDFNGDGLEDLGTIANADAGSYANSVIIGLSQIPPGGIVSMSASPWIKFDAAGDWVTNSIIGDFNGDGQEETIDPNVLYKVADLFGAPQGARFGQGVVQGQIGVDANIQGGTAQ